MKARTKTLLRLKTLLRWLSVGALAACVAGMAPAGATSTGTPQPAFDTWQAPGGASTAGQRVIALTFDDGPGPFTPDVLSVLERYRVPATFFEIGEEVARYPQYTKLVAAAGFPVEDHTWSHPDLATLTAAEVDAQIQMAQAEIRSVVGETPNCLRPPYDAWSPSVLDEIASQHLTAMSYSVDPRDWAMPGVTAIVNGVVGAAFPGAVVDMHDGGGTRSETVAALPRIITGLRAEGYSFVSVCGYLATPKRTYTSAVVGFGRAPSPGSPIQTDSPFAGAAGTAKGYWLCTQDGGVFSAGLPLYGSMIGKSLAKPVVGMAATPDGRGYWLVAADGGIFAFGDALFFGSMGGKPLAKPIVGMAADPATGGYWEVSASGEVFSFGAPSYGSVRAKRLAKPIVGMAATPDGRGYWLVAADGGIFAFGDARFFGSMGGKPLAEPVVGMAADPATGGYWEVSAGGEVFSFGAPSYGSAGTKTTGDRFFAAMATPGGGGYLLAGQRS